MATEQQMVQTALNETVQNIPDALKSVGYATYLRQHRGDLLPPWGTRERERVLRQYDRADTALLWQGARAGLVKKWAGTPWEIAGEPERAAYFQSVLNNAHFGQGWTRLIELVTRDFLRQDGGGYIEVIAPGDPLEPIAAPITGLAYLDSMWCYPTGDPDYPVLYIEPRPDMRNSEVSTTWHKLHRTRVIQLVDEPDGDVWNPGYGMSALSRYISGLYKDLLMARYINAQLDDQPAPGVLVYGNISRATVEAAKLTLTDNLARDYLPPFGRTLELFGIDPTNTPTVESISYAQPPEKFDYKTYVELNVNCLALALGVDKLDIWELTSSGLGSGRQAEIMASKSKGRTYGSFLTSLERVLNLLLPPDLTFEFKTEDEEDEEKAATTARQYADIVSILGDKLSADEARQFLANQVPSIRDAITDEQGRVRRYNDVDQQPMDIEPVTVTDTVEATPTAQSPPPMQIKAFVSGDFAARFRDGLTALTNGETSALAFTIVQRNNLLQAGEKAYISGLKEGWGGKWEFTADDRKALLSWFADQQEYLTRIANDAAGAGWSPDKIAQRAEMWVNKSVYDAYVLGLAVSTSNAKYEWQLGATEEHCPDCLRLNGQVHKMTEWVKSRWLPKTRKLDCGGWLCDCKLVRTTKRSKGNF